MTESVGTAANLQVMRRECFVHGLDEHMMWDGCPSGRWVRSPHRHQFIHFNADCFAVKDEVWTFSFDELIHAVCFFGWLLKRKTAQKVLQFEISELLMDLPV